jgi:hypothetical protein
MSNLSSFWLLHRMVVTHAYQQLADQLSGGDGLNAWGGKLPTMEHVLGEESKELSVIHH